ncbi:proteoglycan 3-like [Saccopteryx bilineata]|uniref:proteoglycan 3-like n=1 Tax=Saccopteryx bilineata TaxID=59482 RepID=UPI00338FFA52
MKHLLLLTLLLLGTVAALHLENDASNLDSRETQADLSQDLEGSGEQDGAWALTGEVTRWEGEQVNDSSCQDDFEDEESDSDAGDEDLQCPTAEETEDVLGSPGCKTCRYKLVRRRRRFWKAHKICRKCYRGNLVSIHSLAFNYRIRCLTSGINGGQVWIGATFRCQRLRWTDGSRWDFSNWAPCQPRRWGGHCVSLGTTGGRWRRRRCGKCLPFICAF